jgi:predicted porin
LDENSSFGFQFQSALGLAYSFNKTYGCFVDAGFHQLNTQQFLTNNLSTIAIKLGFVSAF